MNWDGAFANFLNVEKYWWFCVDFTAICKDACQKNAISDVDRQSFLVKFFKATQGLILLRNGLSAPCAIKEWTDLDETCTTVLF